MRLSHAWCSDIDNRSHKSKWKHYISEPRNILYILYSVLVSRVSVWVLRGYMPSMLTEQLGSGSFTQAEHGNPYLVTSACRWISSFVGSLFANCSNGIPRSRCYACMLDLGQICCW